MAIERHQAAGAYRRWEPPSFDPQEQAPASEPPAEQAPPPASIEAEATLPEDFRFPTAEELERMQEQARAEAHEEGYRAGFAAGQQTGYREGHEAGYRDGLEQARAEAQKLGHMVEALEHAFEQLDAQITEELMGLALAIARKMVGDTLATQPQAIADTVRRALQELPQRSAIIRLHPDDAAQVRELLGDSLAHGAHRMIEDDTLTSGGCVLEAGDTRVDATVQTRWRRIVESLGRDEADWDANDDR